MAPDLARSLSRVTFVLLALAAAAVEVAAVDTRPVGASLGYAAIWIALAAAGRYLAPRPADAESKLPARAVAVIVAVAALPFVAEPVIRRLTDDGNPLELQLVYGLRNIGVGLTACGAFAVCARLSCGCGLFLVLFAAAMSDHPAVMVLLGLYTAAGGVWLMLSHWATLRGSFVEPSRVVTLEVLPGRDRLPRLGLAALVASVAMGVAVMVVGPTTVATALGEWMPTSGGTGAYDPFARGGVNDGDDETKGDNPTGTGMTQTDSFLESPLPSLYDLQSDLFGEPFKPKDVEHSIALDPSMKVFESKKKASDNLRPNREFPTTRKKPSRSRETADRAARAIFEVEGRTPLHVRVSAYDRFDGVSWKESPVTARSVPLEPEPKTLWLVVPEVSPLRMFGGEESHRFKLTAPEGSYLPTPPHLTRVKVGRANRPDFYGWGQDRVLRFAQRKTPSGVVVETVSRVPDPRRLLVADLPSHGDNERLGYGGLPPRLDPRVKALAAEITAGLETTGARAAAVVAYLRDNYAHDRDAVAPAGCADPVSHFLFTSRRGPDYAFATAAAVLMRMSGGASRVVQGFYVDPRHYDAATRHTPVVAEDAHFWPEVQLPNRDWLVLEPTPGYEVLTPAPTLLERLSAVGGYLLDRAAYLAAGAVLLALAVAFRRRLIDVVAVAWWRLMCGRDWRRTLAGAFGVLERRGAWAGLGRPASQTRSGWARERLASTGAELAALADAAAYDPRAAARPEGEVRALCERALREWTTAAGGRR